MIFDPDSDLVTGPAVSGAPPEPVLDVHEIQGNVAPGFGGPYQVLVGVRFDGVEPAAVRRWLAALVPMVSTMWQVNEARNVRRRALRRSVPRPLTPTWLNIALSRDGVALLGADVDEVRDASFRAGMPALSGTLGDPHVPAQAGHTSMWVVGGSPETVPHALLVLAGDDSDGLDRRHAELAAWASECGIAIGYVERADALPHDKEHFGFRDGISQVGVRGRLSALPRHFLTRRYLDPDDALALTHSRPGQPLVWPGQFVFGYPRQDPGDLVAPRLGPPADGGRPWMRNGSFLVFRRLRQDVAAFRAFVGAEAARVGGGLTADRLAALLVGRWPEGTALVRNPDGDDADPMGDRLVVNHFGYAQSVLDAKVCADPLVAVEESETALELRVVAGTQADFDGLRCPRTAHVRKVNPRDRPTDRGGPDRTLTFQVLRRGITFGPPHTAGDAVERGLLFLSYQTSIVNQFEVLNTGWMNQADPPEGDSGHDLLVGQAHRTGRRARLPDIGDIATLSTWVVPTGGGYFFSPSITTLTAWATNERP